MTLLIYPKKVAQPLFVAFVLTCLGLLPEVQAVVPPPDGGYPGFNTAEGQNALFSLTTGAGNTAIGWYSLFSNAAGSFNTATGAGALLFNTESENTAFGTAALLFNTTGAANTAVGAAALLNNTTGFNNTANGFQALANNNTGVDNTANGFQALANNTTGFSNTANGAFALQFNTIGATNTATGESALFSNQSGTSNTATGKDALADNTSGNFNTAIGFQTLTNNNTGGGNTALGTFAGNGIISANNVIAIGSNAANVSDSCFIGNIRGVTTSMADAIPVVIDSFGQLGTMSSSRRFKNRIKPMDEASEVILALKPVTFHYNNDNTATPQFGLLAEEVAKVNPALVMFDKEGKPYTVRYDAVNAMLLNEFLKEHRKVEEQQKEIDALKAELKAQKALIQKVSNIVELNRPLLQAVVTNE